MPLLGIPTDQNFKLNLRETLKKRRVPGFCAALHRRNITAILVIARKTKPHGHDRDFGWIVEICLIDLQPFTQAHAGWIGKWAA